MRSRHLSVVIPRHPDEVYALAADPAGLPGWAAGLASGAATVEGDALTVDSPMGRVRVEFVPRNTLGVLDHEVTLPDGSVTHNPLRVLPHPEGAEVVFTIRQQGMSSEDFERDCAMVREDLIRLRHLVDPSPVMDSPGPGIRIAEPADAQSVARLLAEFNAEFDCPGPDPGEGAPRIERLLSGGDVLVVVASTGPGGHDVGFGFLTLRPTAYWDGPLAQLEDLYVRPSHRSHGIGTALLDRVVTEVRARHGREVHINVDDDTDARRFYVRNGFSDIDPDSGSGMGFFLRQL